MKYRVWHPDEKRFVDRLIVLADGTVLNNLSDREGIMDLLPVSNATVQLKSHQSDRFGTPIFEGDFVKVQTQDEKIWNVFEVKFGNSERVLVNLLGDRSAVEICGFYYTSISCSNCFPITENWKGGHDSVITEVIGNIFENPEIRTGSFIFPNYQLAGSVTTASVGERSKPGVSKTPSIVGSNPTGGKL